MDIRAYPGERDGVLFIAKMTVTFIVTVISPTNSDSTCKGGYHVHNPHCA